MKYTYKTLLCSGLLSLAVGLGMTSCEDYLDKSPESTVSEEDAFKNFRNFQGFIEEIYNCIPDKEKCNYCTSWNWGDDELFNSMGDAHMTHQADLGNFRAWQTNGQCWLYRNPSNPASTDKFQHSLWPHSWYCIRKANVGLANLDKLVGTQVGSCRISFTGMWCGQARLPMAVALSAWPSGFLCEVQQGKHGQRHRKNGRNSRWLLLVFSLFW